MKSYCSIFCEKSKLPPSPPAMAGRGGGACMGFRGTPCHVVAHKGEDGSRTVLGAKKRPCSTLHPPIADRTVS